MKYCLFSNTLSILFFLSFPTKVKRNPTIFVCQLFWKFRIFRLVEKKLSFGVRYHCKDLIKKNETVFILNLSIFKITVWRHQTSRFIKI